MGASLRCAYAPLDVRGCTVNQLINHNETQFRIHKHTHRHTSRRGKPHLQLSDSGAAHKIAK